MEKRELPVVSFSISNKFGAGFEESKIKGIAHVIEHLLFTGTKTRSNEDISREIEKKGGVLNAFTAHEITSYWFKLPSEHLFKGIDILIDMIKNPLFNKEKFEKEKRVILEEIKMYHDDPMRSAMEQIEKNMFESPFGELIIGNKESVSSLDRDFVADYYLNNYKSGNFFVTIVGDADFEEVCEHLEREFEGEARELKIGKIKKKNGESIEKREHLDQAHLVFGVHGPLPSEDDFYALEVLDAYLANGMSSKLFLEIREKRGLAYAVTSSINCEKSYCIYTIYVGTTKEAFEDVKKLILQGFKDVEKMNERDLEEAKERVVGLRKVRSEESVNVMNELVFAELQGDAEDYYLHDSKIEKVKLKDVKRLAKELIEQGHSVVGVVPK